MKHLDKLTLLLTQCFNVLLVKHPERTSVGVILGIVIDLFLKMFTPALTGHSLIDVNAIHWWHLIACGTFLAYVPRIIQLMRNNNPGNEGINEIIQQIESANYSEDEKRQYYRQLTQKLIDGLSLDDSVKELILKTKAEISKEKEGGAE